MLSSFEVPGKSGVTTSNYWTSHEKSSALLFKMHVKFLSPWFLEYMQHLSSSLRNTAWFLATTFLPKSRKLLIIQVKICTFTALGTAATKTAASSTSATSASTTSSFTSTAAPTSSWFRSAFEIHRNFNNLLDSARCLNFLLNDLKVKRKKLLFFTSDFKSSLKAQPNFKTNKKTMNNSTKSLSFSFIRYWTKKDQKLIYRIATPASETSHQVLYVKILKFAMFACA